MSCVTKGPGSLGSPQVSQEASGELPHLHANEKADLEICTVFTKVLEKKNLNRTIKDCRGSTKKVTIRIPEEKEVKEKRLDYKNTAEYIKENPVITFDKQWEKIGSTYARPFSGGVYWHEASHMYRSACKRL